jgi:predicted RNA methylase
MKNHSQQIKPEVIDLLKQLECDGTVVKKWQGTLSRKEYQDLDVVLQAIGGKWSRKHQGHVFGSDAQAIIDRAIEEGTFTDAKKAFELYETPVSLAEEIVERACLETTDIVLEPSAGNGRLLEAILKAGAIAQANELNEAHKPKLLELFDKYKANYGDDDPSEFKPADYLTIGDFLEMKPKPIYQKVIMNPPFSRGQDMAHVRHAYDFLDADPEVGEEGRLIAIMSPHFTSACDKKSKEFKNWADDLGATWEELPEGSFKESGTSVRTIVFEVFRQS